MLACGVTGKDEAGEIVLGLRQEQKIDTSGVSTHQEYTNDEETMIHPMIFVFKLFTVENRSQ